jgi:transcriptional regulator with XRE-family HTH domain
MRNYKPISTESAQRLGRELRCARNLKTETLDSISKKIKVDVGQLSRFERGRFKAASKNLHKYAEYLQISLLLWTDDLGERFRNLAARSAEHRAAFELILDALERLG